jgi:hypothetical protein
MDVKPAKDIKVICDPTKEAIFGEDGVEVKKTSVPIAKQRLGVLTGRTLAGFAEVEMAAIDGKKHWYPTEEMLTDKGERIVEEELAIEVPAEDEGDGPAAEGDGHAGEGAE